MKASSTQARATMGTALKIKREIAETPRLFLATSVTTTSDERWPRRRRFPRRQLRSVSPQTFSYSDMTSSITGPWAARSPSKILLARYIVPPKTKVDGFDLIWFSYEASPRIVDNHHYTHRRMYRCHQYCDALSGRHAA